MATLILLRHGESEGNSENLFASWTDVDLTARGRVQARRAAVLIADNALRPDVVHTSVLRRTIESASILLRDLDRSWIPVRRSWRLNERQYGALTGQNKAAVRLVYGDERFALWRRSYDTPPPPLSEEETEQLARDPRYALLASDVPRTESLRDVTTRLLPYWYDVIVPDLRLSRTVLVCAHSNSLRALIKHLDQISDDAVVDLNVPTGIPLVYALDDATFAPTRPADYLDTEAAKRGIAEVSAQGYAT